MMRTSLLVGVSVALCGWESASAQGAKQFIQAELLKTIKAKKAKVGDVVKARPVQTVTLASGLTIPDDATLIGEVRSADEKSLAISFDQVQIKGKTTPVKLSIRSAMQPGEAPAASRPGDATSSLDAATPGNRSIRGEAAHTRKVTESEPPGSGTPGAPVAAHTGSVIGMPGVTLEVDESPQRASKFVSADKELQLKSGMQLMLAVVE
ncbi:MAG TPA: hypothetical protein VLZ81_12800 [Blastocatellia bacterium]|nr:hypothetical protein [Blastocatellia bacterium]